ncbi:hypothetical protein QLQ15_05005 [Lysobacter sp. LF1]|uniref:Uncharacterized protein n=1 Tax=Lysobacter stagni TaxID=3045172 RepID=A0ABT6XDP8_9GAMM|nr:hypothetical protein [Lysobacter sp. LF1]MDI9238269.1 hypothetical protein [Lysobacter sp. LF1]
MRASLEDWKNGWVEIEVGLSVRDIDLLIASLQVIKADPDQHFHATSDFIGEGGIGQITFQIQQPSEANNLSLGSRAVGPSESIDL